MRRCIASLLLILFGTLSCVPQMDGHELMRMGALAEHYNHHVVDHGETELTFVGFLIDHYGVPPSSQSEPFEHSSLPLHTNVFSIGVAMSFPLVVEIPTVSSSTIVVTKAPFPNMTPTDCSSGPEHPPR